MKKLIRVKRAMTREMYAVVGGRYEIKAIPGVAIRDDDAVDLSAACEFFVVEERGHEQVMQELAKLNPGCEVELFVLQKVGQCPAGDFVAKEVTKDGLLPA
jgi:hypothetical protein